ncbi:MAG: hypothetical protein HY860_03805 [Chlamydiales bacterium]|nr:hypothetical protein [Chlamydiales bacterium]
MINHPIATKANRIFFIIVIAFILIILRIWYLMTIGHDDYARLSKAPQRKTFIETPDRGTIRDRFNEPLAVNKLLYTASVCYDDFKQIPRYTWNKQLKKKIYTRKDYIKQFAQMLEKELHVEATYIEDLIYSKAAIFPNTPFVIKENIPEELYAKLKMMQKDFPGLRMDIRSYRYYPNNYTACNIIGYLGHINSNEYFLIKDQIDHLKRLLEQKEDGIPTPLPMGYSSWKQVKARLDELKEKSYGLHSMVGKSGIEKQFDEDLRGVFGKKKYEVDIQGKLVRVLPDSSKSINGRRVLLSISKELQEYAEQLLTENEKIRDERFRFAGKGHGDFHPPWIKGGSIVVLDPNNGEVLCAASYPRFNSNDFVSIQHEDSTDHNKQVMKWLETDEYIERIWQGEFPLEKELYTPSQGYYMETKYLSWDLFLDYLLAINSEVRKQLRNIKDIQTAAYLLNCMETLIQVLQTEPITIIDFLFSEKKGHKTMLTKDTSFIQIAKNYEYNKKIVDELKESLDKHLNSIHHNGDKLLLLDLLKLVCPHRSLSDEIIAKIGHFSISEYWNMHQLLLQLKRSLRDFLKISFHKELFPQWREANFKDYLSKKREIEKENKRYQKPYLDYLEEAERKEFDSYFKQNEHRYLLKVLFNHTDRIIFDFHHPAIEKLKNILQNLPIETIYDLVLCIRSLPELESSLWGYYPRLHTEKALEQDLARYFYPQTGFGYLRSYAYQEPVALGSIYKIAVAYEAIKQNKERHHTLNPLTIFDEIKTDHVKNKGQILGYTQDRKPITRLYKGGRMPKSHKSSGKIDLIGALEQSSNIYFSLLASEVIDDPKDLYLVSKQLSFGKKTGIDLPSEHPGFLPNDLSDNKSGLYSFAIGQHAFAVTPLQTAVMMSTFANGGSILKPQIVKMIANIEPLKTASVFDEEYNPFQDYLSLVGIYFPFFSEANKKLKKPYLVSSSIKHVDHIQLDKDIQKYLFYALHRVMNNKDGSGRASAIRLLYENPQMRSHYIANQPQMVGKTGTAEIAFKPTLDLESSTILTTNIWFAGVYFEDKALTKPELVVVVLLRYGDYGKEAAPLASEMITKWHEIKRKHAD